MSSKTHRRPRSKGTHRRGRARGGGFLPNNMIPTFLRFGNSKIKATLRTLAGIQRDINAKQQQLQVLEKKKGEQELILNRLRVIDPTQRR